jgi:hypothetical protein
MTDCKQIIEQLKNLDLKAYPYDKIRELLNQIGPFGVIRMVLHPRKILLRARVNENGEIFSLREQLSYKPAQYNKTYQRASTPNQTMFYAGTIAENLKPGELNNARIISSLEGSNLLRDSGKEGEQTITFSKWVVTKDIPLFAVCYHKDLIDKSSHTRELYDFYQESTKQLTKDMQEKSIAVTEYLAEEFAKKTISADFDYMISAIFTEMTVKKGLVGMYYPSVRADAMGYNVAILPEAVDSSLNLVAVGECKMYKKGEHTIVDNETVCEIGDDSVPFTLKQVDPEYHIGHDKILEELNKSK